MYSMPFRMTSRLISQKARKQMAVLWVTCPHDGASVVMRVLMASPPIQVWMPNHPQATRARRTAAMFAPRTPKLARARTGNGMP
jgi:hypothetical protein